MFCGPRGPPPPCLVFFAVPQLTPQAGVPNERREGDGQRLRLAFPSTWSRGIDHIASIKERQLSREPIASLGQGRGGWGRYRSSLGQGRGGWGLGGLGWGGHRSSLGQGRGLGLVGGGL